MKKLFFLITLTIPLLCVILSNTEAKEYTKEEICSAIFIIEGGKNTRSPYGIKSVKCNGKEECRQVCYNTIENNKVRYAEYGHKEYGTYLEFLQSRYCPLSDKGCEHWLPNLKFYLEKK